MPHYLQVQFNEQINLSGAPSGNGRRVQTLERRSDSAPTRTVFKCLLQAALMVWSVAQLSAAVPGTRYVISELGAIADGKTVNTAAIQGAIDKCAIDGGGTVVVPAGTYLTGALFFKQNVNLEVLKDGVLKGTTQADDYPLVPTRWEGVEREWTAALLNFFSLTNVFIGGQGTIDGSGDEWTALFPRRRPGPPMTGAITTGSASTGVTVPGSASALNRSSLIQRRGRPRLIALQNCTHVRVSNLHLKNEASWGLFMVYCEDVLAENIVVRAEHNIPSSDGMDIDSCKNVRVTGSDIDVNDDCISIKSGKDEDGRRVNRPCEDIVVEKTRFGFGHGGVALGSEISGGIRNVEVRDCIVEAGNLAAVRFKSQPSRGGVLENITYRNIDIRDARQAVEVELSWRVTGPPVPPAPVLTKMQAVRLINVSGHVASAGLIHGYKEAPADGIVFESCQLTAQRGLALENVGKIDTSGLHITVAEGEPIFHREPRKIDANPVQ